MRGSLSGRTEILFLILFITDARSVKELEMVLSRYTPMELFEITGYPPGFMCPLNKIIWIKNNRPDIFKRTRRIMFTDEIFAQKLGVEEPRINHSLASRTLFFDVRKKTWWNDILVEFGIDPLLFSKPVDSGEVIGTISDKVAAELGLKGVYFVSGCHDQPVLRSTGAVTGGISADGMGTGNVSQYAWKMPSPMKIC